MRRRQELVELLKASAQAIFIMWIGTVALFWLGGLGNDLQMVVALSVALLSPLVIGGFLLIWGWPLHMLLRKYEMTSLAWYVLFGFIPGPMFIGYFKPFGEDAVRDLIFQAVFCGFIGTLGAAVYWLKLVRAKP